MIQFNLWTPVYANDLDAFVPEIWAQEGLLLLENNMVAGNLVHRDFSDEIANFGDTVNTRLPATFAAQRKIDSDNVTVQDANVTNVPVVLNQHLHTSFLVRDGEETKGFQVLRETLLAPAMLSIAEAVDAIVLGQAVEFLTLDDGSANVVGQLGVTPTKETVIAVRNKMNQNKVPFEGRNLVITPQTEADLLAIDSFVTADKIGDDGSALREASLGMKYGIRHWMDQNTSFVPSGSTTVAGAVNNAAGYAAGTTTMTVDGFAAAITNGSWFVVAGDNTPQRVVSTVGGATPTSITFVPGLSNSVADDAVVTVYTPGAINEAAGYANGYAKTLTVDGFTVAPAAGQPISINGATPTGTEAVYTAINTPTTTALLLNRPLEASAADDDVVAVGPAGSYNFAFHRNALAMVSRPLAAPAAGTGALSFTASFNGLAMRVTITYNGSQQGHLVTCDLLMGVKVLDRRLGLVMLA